MSGNYLYERDKYAERFIGVIRWVGVVLPAFVGVYTLLAMNGLVPVSDLFDPRLAMVVTAGMMLAGVWQFATRNYTGPAVVLRLGAFHLLAGAYFVLVSGFTSPAVFSWFALIVISEIFFGPRGAAVSIAALLGFSAASLVLNGERIDVLFQALAVLFATIFSAVFTVVIRSITKDQYKELLNARKNRASERSQLVSILNSMSMAVLSVDENGVIRLYNAAFLSLLDTNNTLTGRSINEVLSLVTTSGEAVKPLDLVQKSYMTRREDILLKYTDSDEVRLGVLINPIRGAHNKLSGYIFIFEDITKEKSLEEERDEFISVISHELRTPIAISEGSISNAKLLLKRGAAPEVLSQTFDEAHEQIIFLSNMINDLGTLSRAERGVGDTLEAINIDRLAAELHAKYEPHAREQKLHFNLDIVGRIGTVTTSQLYLEEILQNFITNSIKYTQKGSVTLRIKKVRDGVCFAVIDTGIGMSKADQKRVFEKFYRSEDYRTRETSGTGLGLYVVQKLAHKLGVEVVVTSKLNHGSTFSFVLPIK